MRGRGRGLGPGFLIEEIIPTFPRHAALMLGFVQMLLGLTSFTGAILAEVYYAYNYIIYDGFWCGSFFFTSASAAMHAGRFPTPRRVRGTIVCAVISFAFVATEFGLSVDGLVENVEYPTAYPYGYTFIDYDFPAMEAANGLMLSACGVEMILLIVQIYIGARALKETPNETVDSTGNAGRRWQSGVSLLNLTKVAVSLVSVFIYHVFVYKPRAVSSGAQVVMPPYGHMQPTVTVIGPQQPPFQQMPPQQYYPQQPPMQPPQPQQPPFQQMPPQQYYYTNTAFAAPPAYDPSAPPNYVK